MNKTKLDLHGTRIAEVRQKVIAIIEDNWDSGNKLEIITGHSNSMKKEVIEVINEYNLAYTVGDYFKFNLGYITVET